MTEIPPTPPPPTAKKGIPVIGWIGIGCGTILIIAIMAISMLVGFCAKKVGEFSKHPEKSAAEMMVRLNPDLKMVSQDDAKGEMTIRTKDGQTMTMSYKDVASGKFTVKDAQGNVSEFGSEDLSKLPAWVPRVPDLENAFSSTQQQGDGKTSGIYTGTSPQSAEKLEKFFKTEMEKLKATSSNSSSTTVNGTESRVLGFENGGRKINIAITAKSGEATQVSVGFEEEK